MGARLKLLLDSNTLYWWARQSPSLSAKAQHAIQDTDAKIFVSAVTPWELAIKGAAGKLDCGSLLNEFAEYLFTQGFSALDISVNHGIRAGALPMKHRDPFDRMLAAQAQVEGLAIVSSDPIFEQYGVPRVW